MTRNFCTVADSNFTSRIQALNFSLTRHNNDYILHLLCLDDTIYNRISDNKIIKYRLSDLLDADDDLKNSRLNYPSREALTNASQDIEKAKQIQFIWTLSPYFTDYCLNHIHNQDSILYIDSDIYFFDSLDSVYENIDYTSVGLVEHRIPYNHNNGKYNVGIVYFKNDTIGKACARFWKNCLLFTDHKFYNSHGDCGDQKYLELFENMFPKVTILDKFIGHLAPWNINFHQYYDNIIIWNNKKQKLLYYHFSNFQPNFTNNTFIPAPRHGIYEITNNSFLNDLHTQYYNALKEFEC